MKKKAWILAALLTIGITGNMIAKNNYTNNEVLTKQADRNTCVITVIVFISKC